jgi:cytochrome c biogenesis protein CcdA
MFERVNVLTAFLAGLLSFFSPCALPLVPLYLGHLAGSGGGAMPVGRPARVRLMGNAVAFVVGFSAIFVLLFGLPAGVGPCNSRGTAPCCSGSAVCS